MNFLFMLLIYLYFLTFTFEIWGLIFLAFTKVRFYLYFNII